MLLLVHRIVFISVAFSFGVVYSLVTFPLVLVVALISVALLSVTKGFVVSLLRVATCVRAGNGFSPVVSLVLFLNQYT